MSEERLVTSWESQNSLPHIAVLMATYNGDQFIEEQINSILAQKNVQVSLYIRDDHSTDRTREIIDTYQRSNGKIFLLPSKSEQLNVTRNFFSIVCETDLSDMDYIAYSDQDDIWLENKLDAAVTAMQKNNVNCYASNLLRGNALGQVIRQSSVLSRVLNYLLNFKSNNQLRWDHYFEAASAGCSLVMNKQAAIYLQSRLRNMYDKIPLDASHDWSTYAITRIGGNQWYIDSNAYIIYRQHSGNAYGTNNGFKGIAKLVDLFRSGWYRKHILMIDELYNNTDTHPDFMKQVRNYQYTSLSERIRLAFAVSGQRRKPVHRIFLFGLIIFGYLK